MQETENVATGRAVILEIVRAMRENVEPLMFSTIAPTRFYVYLHPSDHKRLEGIFSLVIEQARQALDAEVQRSRQKAGGVRRWLSSVVAPGDTTQPAGPIDAPPDGWEIRFEPDLDGEMQPGDIAVASELVLPARPDLAGSQTRRVTTMQSGGKTSRREQVLPTGSIGSRPPGTAPVADGTVWATLTYEDQQGAHRLPMSRSEIVIGRGGVGYWVDVKVHTSADVSREHVRLRRDAASGQFFLKDLSSLGTTLDGQPVPSSIEVVEGRKRDKEIEVPLPPHAQIGLAGVVVIQFDAGQPS
ncbi:MAG: FHA domain-containing protein [Bacteroidales bacterium]